MDDLKKSPLWQQFLQQVVTSTGVYGIKNNIDRNIDFILKPEEVLPKLKDDIDKLYDGICVEAENLVKDILGRAPNLAQDPNQLFTLAGSQLVGKINAYAGLLKKKYGSMIDRVSTGSLDLSGGVNARLKANSGGVKRKRRTKSSSAASAPAAPKKKKPTFRQQLKKKRKAKK